MVRAPLPDKRRRSELHGWIPPSQSAYRQNHSTVDALICISSDILDGFKQQKTTILVQIDFTKAFDKVWSDGLRFTLHKLGLRGPLLAWISNFLSNRYYRVVKPAVSQYVKFDIGTPQGSSLSALLFILYTSSLIKQLTTAKSGFADDVAIWRTHHNLHESISILNHQLKLIERWRDQYRLPISATKTSFTIFTKLQIHHEELPPLILDGVQVKHNATPRFLGLTFDQRLTWSVHIANLVTANQPKVTQLKRLHSTPWRNSRQSLLMFYKTFIRPPLEYASEVWSSASPSNLKKVDRLQSNALKIITGAHPSTPIIVLESDTLCSSLNHRRQKQLASTLFRVSSLPCDSPLFKRLCAWKPIAKSFFTIATAAHRSLFKQEPNRKEAPFPPPIPPWQTNFVPPKPRPITRQTKFNREALSKLRSLQALEYSNHRHTMYYRQFRPKITQKWKSADLKNFNHSATILRLRSGHSNLFAHDRLSQYSHCPCGPPLTAEHALLECNLSTEITTLRDELLLSLKKFINFDEKPSLSQLLSPPQCSLIQQREHLTLVAKFAQKLPYPP